MIKRSHLLQTSTLILTIIGTFGSVFAQDIVVMGGANVRIVDGSSQPGFYALTEFGDVDVASGSKTHAFYIENLDLDTVVSITGANITGSTDFTLSTPINDNSIGAFSRSFFEITFNPSTVGEKSATMTITNNDPDGSEGSFNFVLHGSGVDTLGLAPPDIAISANGINFVTNKKGTKASGKILVENIGPGATQGGTLQVWSSNDFYLDFEPKDILVAEIPLKPLPAFVSGQKNKRQTIGINVSPAQTSHGALFFRAVVLPASPVDADFGNNVAARGF